MPLSYQRKIHRGEIHPVTLHPCKRQEKLYLTEQRPHIPWIHLPSSGLVRIWSLGRSQQLFFCVFSHFRHGDDQTNEQPGDPSASLLLTSEKAVFCKICWEPTPSCWAVHCPRWIPWTWFLIFSSYFPTTIWVLLDAVFSKIGSKAVIKPMGLRVTVWLPGHRKWGWSDDYDVASQH